MIIRDPIDDRWRKRVGGRVLQVGRGQPTGRRAAPIMQNWHRTSQYATVRLSNAWRALSDTDRAEWEAFGASFPQTDKYGNEVFYNGWIWFCKLRTRQEMLRISLGATPPTDPDPEYSPTLSIVYFPLFRSIAASPSTSPTGDEIIIIERSLNNPPRTNIPPNPFVDVLFFRATSATPYVIAPSFTVEVGPRRHYFRYYAYDNAGRKSIPVTEILDTVGV